MTNATTSPADEAACNTLYAAGLDGLPWWEAPSLAEEAASDPCDPAIYDRLIEAHRAGACERARRAVATAVDGMRTPCDPFLPSQGEVEPNWLGTADAAELVDVELTQFDASALIEVAAEAADIPAENIVSIVGEFCPLPANAPSLAEWALRDYQRIPAKRQVPGPFLPAEEVHREFVEMAERAERRGTLPAEWVELAEQSRLAVAIYKAIPHLPADLSRTAWAAHRDLYSRTATPEMRAISASYLEAVKDGSVLRDDWERLKAERKRLEAKRDRQERERLDAEWDRLIRHKQCVEAELEKAERAKAALSERAGEPAAAPSSQKSETMVTPQHEPEVLTRVDQGSAPPEPTQDELIDEANGILVRWHEIVPKLEMPPPALRLSAAVPILQPSAFTWTDPTTIPRREWLYAHHLIRREISLTLAPGGVGKTSLLIAEALAMASGRQLLHDHPPKPLRVWFWSGEEPADELARRIMAAAIHFGLTPSDIEGRLFVDNGHQMPLVIAKQDRDGTRILEPVANRLVQVLRQRQIDVMIVDPFISSHKVPENDTLAMQEAATAWKSVAVQAGAAIELSHHTRKIGNQEATVDDGRGGSPLRDKARHARALSPMSQAEASSFGLRPGERFSYFASGAGEKSNMAARATAKTWYRLESVGLGNDQGPAKPQDHVAVVTPWAPIEVPQDLDPVAVSRLADILGKQQWRASPQAADWIGYAVAEAFAIATEGDWKGEVKPIVAALERKKVILRGGGQDKNRKPVPVFTMGTREMAEI